MLPAVVAAGAIAGTLALRRLAREAEARIRRQGEGSRWVRLAPALSATSDGVDEALRQLRQANPLLLVGLAGFLVFDHAHLLGELPGAGRLAGGGCHRDGLPDRPSPGNWLPIPGGIGGVELGLVGALVLYGLPALTATAAVLLYRAISLWIPALLGVAAFVQLRLLLRRETEAIKLCEPGDTVETVGLGPRTAELSSARASPLRSPSTTSS